MAENVVAFCPADEFTVVCDAAKERIVGGLIIGYDNNGELEVYGGGLICGKRPVAKDWLWLVEQFKTSLMNDEYF